MAIYVEFPDGTVRAVASHLRPLTPYLHDGPPEFEQVPLNCDPVWRYDRKGQRWIACRRNPGVTTLQPATVEWWCSIDQMQGPATVSVPLLQRPDQDGTDPFRSAA